MLSEKQINLIESQGLTRISTDNGSCVYYTYYFRPVNGIYLKLTVEDYNGTKVTFKNKPFYTLQVKTLSDDEIDSRPIHGFNGAYLDKGLFITTTFNTIIKKYGLSE